MIDFTAHLEADWSSYSVLFQQDQIHFFFTFLEFTDLMFTFHNTIKLRFTSLQFCINLTGSSRVDFLGPSVLECCAFLHCNRQLWKKKSAHGVVELIICKSQLKGISNVISISSQFCLQFVRK